MQRPSRSLHKVLIRLPARECAPYSDSPIEQRVMTQASGLSSGPADPTHPSSTPPTRTAILRGNGDTSEVVIGGTAPRPCSEDVCVSITRRLFDNVAARFWLNCCRSGYQSQSNQDQERIPLCGMEGEDETDVALYLFRTLVDVSLH